VIEKRSSAAPVNKNFMGYSVIEFEVFQMKHQLV
jgi:hypothetical protein